MKSLTFGLVLCLSWAVGTNAQVKVKAGALECNKEWLPKVGDTAPETCKVIASEGHEPVCANKLKADKTADGPLIKCESMEGCTMKTEHGKECQKTNYKGKEYPKGTCIYIDGDGSHETGWCGTVDPPPSSESAYVGPPGLINWDWCNKDCKITAAAARAGGGDAGAGAGAGR